MKKIERVTIAGHRLPAAEAAVLRVLLDAGGPLLVTEVNERVPGRARAHTTVVTLLGRLVDRGLVDREPAGRGHRYFAAGSEQDLAVRALAGILDGIDDPANALVAFINRLPARTKRGVTDGLRRPGRGGQ